MSVVETANLSAHLSSRRGEHEEAPEQVLFLFGRENPARRFCVWLGTVRADALRTAVSAQSDACRCNLSLICAARNAVAS
eukprot:2901596-Rhodomonas_salina.6